MEKPLSILIKDLTQKFVKDINESGLPPVILAYIVKDVNNLIQEAASKQLMNEEREYYTSLQTEEKPKE